MATEEKTLVIVLAETRAWEKTFDNIKQNVLAPLNADLCVCIGTKPNYNYDNSFYQEAKYRFIYNEPDDWADAFNYALEGQPLEGQAPQTPRLRPAGEQVEGKVANRGKITTEKVTNQVINQVVDGGLGGFTPLQYKGYININAIWCKLSNWDKSTENIDFLGRYPDEREVFNDAKVIAKKYEEIVFHAPEFPDPQWRYCAYGIKRAFYQNPMNNMKQPSVITMRLQNAAAAPATEPWRRFLQIPKQFLGGIKDATNEHPGSAAILIFFRWFLWKNLVKSGAAEKYDRFIITRSDYIWRLEHPRIELLSSDKIWVPDSEQYEGITDRHTVIPRQFMQQYCGILDAMLGAGADEYYKKMKSSGIIFNLEKLILFHLTENAIPYDFFPYVMFTIRPPDVETRWMAGTQYCESGDYYIKYPSEDYQSQKYVNEFIEWRRKTEFTGTLDEFYAARLKSPNRGKP